jgi:hypothetical protein
MGRDARRGNSMGLFMSEYPDVILSVRVASGAEIPTVLCANGKEFRFQPEQIHFIVAMQRLKNVYAASISVGREEGWGRKFLESRKFREYVANKIQEFSDKNSLNVEWWYQYGKRLSEGKRTFSIGRCGCGFSSEFLSSEVELYRKDDMTLEFPCPVCFKVMEVELRTEAFKPTREQVEGWKELGSRLIPKVERVHHQFEKVDIEFQSEEV